MFIWYVPNASVSFIIGDKQAQHACLPLVLYQDQKAYLLSQVWDEVQMCRGL